MWDLWYIDDRHSRDYNFMIWPEFLNNNGEVIIQRQEPVEIKGKAIL